MENSQNSDKRLIILMVILVVLAAAIRLSIAFCDMPTLITKTVSDDSFYYFQIAKNAAAGNGVSFDGVEPANGFHPLWFLLLLPVYYVFGGTLALPVHIALALEGLLDVGAGILIYSLVVSLTKNRLAGVLGAAAYLLNPSIIFHSVNGLETGLNLFCFCLYFWYYVRMLKREEFSAREILTLGLLSGLLMLARTDNFILVGVTYAHLVFLRKLITRPGVLAGSVVVAAAVAAPWLIWNALTFGTIMQSSASAYGIIARGNLEAGGFTNVDILMLRVSDTLKLFIWTIPTDVFGWGKLLGVLAGLALGLTLADGSRAARVWTAARLACVPLLAVLAVLVTHSLIRGTIKSWYLMPAAAVAAIFLGILCGAFDPASLLASARGRIALALVALVILSGFAYNGWNAWGRGMFAWQSEQGLAAEWLKENTDDDVLVGSFNAGIIGYMSERNVVNLDGLVNNSVVPFLEQRRLWEYIEQRDIDYLVDSDYSILKDYRDFYGPGWDVRGNLDWVATIDDPAVSWAGANVAVYRVVK
jgi:hypothetical protein